MDDGAKILADIDTLRALPADPGGVQWGPDRPDLAARARRNVAGRPAPEVARIGVHVRDAETARRHVVGSLASAGRLAGSNAGSSRMARPTTDTDETAEITDLLGRTTDNGQR